MQHIGYIMDGNRSWAKAKWFLAFAWHRQWYETAKKIIRETKKRGIPFASFWALSDDNIVKRSPEEIRYLFWLLEKWILDLAKDANKQNIRIVCVWDRSLLPETCVESMVEAETLTSENTEMVVILAIGYGWQEEIARAVRSLALTWVDMTWVSTSDIVAHIETRAYPQPDLIIRTWGHMRHSGFLLFQSPYAEYYFSDLLWPDFCWDELDRAISDYENRERKYGK